MGKLDLPPRYVVAPARLVYADLPRSIVLTGIRIWGLGWRYNYDRTAAVWEEDLQELLRLRRAALFEHLKRLAAAGVLRYTYVNARFTFDFTATRLLSRGPPGDQTVSPDFWTQRDMSVAVDDLKVSTDSDRRQQHQNARAREALHDLGVMEPTLSEIVGLDWVTEDYVQAWRAWYEERGDQVGVGFLVEQWRAGEIAPERARQREERLRHESYARYNVQT